MPHNWCPPSRRGHMWRELNSEDPKTLRSQAPAFDPRSIRVCKRCGKLGCVSNQGVIHVVGAP